MGPSTPCARCALPILFMDNGMRLLVAWGRTASVFVTPRRWCYMFVLRYSAYRASGFGDAVTIVSGRVVGGREDLNMEI
jgi:hypothetical protein